MVFSDSTINPVVVRVSVTKSLLELCLLLGRCGGERSECGKSKGT